MKCANIDCPHGYEWGQNDGVPYCPQCWETWLKIGVES